MESTETDSKIHEGHLEVVANEKLEPGANFFDQEPFHSAIAESASTFRVDQAMLQFAFASLIAKQASQSRAHSDADSFRVLAKSLHLSGSYAEPYVAALRSITTRLNEFPHYQEYVLTQKDRTDYRHDGTAVLRHGHYFEQTPTYACWVVDRLRREGMARLVGIEEVFPQDLGEQTIRDALARVAGGNASSGRRRWRILRASELAAERPR